jgi:hypothetical protein
MKKIIIILLFLIVFTKDIFSQQKQSGYYSSYEEQVRREYAQHLKQEQGKNSFFGRVDVPWLDGVIMRVLQYFDGIHWYFNKQVKIIAAICLTLALGIGAFKLIFGMIELNKLLVETLMSIIIYMIVLHIFPFLMKNIYKITIDMAYESIYNYPLPRYDQYGGSQTGFVEFIQELAAPEQVTHYSYTRWNGEKVDTGTGITGFTKATWNNLIRGAGTLGAPVMAAITSEKGYNEKDADFRNMIREYNMSGIQIITANLVDKNSGLISFNRLAFSSTLVFRGVWKTVNKPESVFELPKLLGDIIIGVAVSFVYIWSIFVASGNYLTCLIQFGFLYGVGILMIPFMLWSGSKSLFESLVRGMINISVHLLIKSMIIFMIIFINVEIIYNLYIFSMQDTVSRPTAIIEMYLTVLFLSTICKLYADQSTAIADFLLGGSPRIGVGELTQAAKSTAAGLGAGAKVTGGLAKTAGGAALTGVGALAAAGSAARAAYGFEKAGTPEGEKFNKGQAIKSAMGAAGRTLGNAAVQGGASAFDGAMGMIGKSGSAARNFSNFMQNGMMPGSAPSGSGGGGHGGRGGGSGDGRGAENFGERAEEKKKEDIKNAEAESRSTRAPDRNRSMGDQYAALKASGQYNGVSGSVKALRSSIGSFHRGNATAYENGAFGGNMSGLSKNAQNYIKEQARKAEAE